MTAVATFAGGLILLLGFGHVVVRNASKLGARYGLSPMVVGLTIVAAGTSAPELAVVAQAIAVDDTELAVGSIIGSNIANVLLVLGLAATFGTIHVTSRAIRIDIPVMIAASAALVVFALDGQLGRVDGAIFLVALLGFVWWTLQTSNRNAALVDEPHPSKHVEPEPVLPTLITITGAAAALAVAARFVVRGAEDIATALGMPELIIGLTVVALGTSAPEIVTTLVAAASGRRELAVGNAVGSNIFNILLVLGVAGASAPNGIGISDDALRLDLPVLLAAAIACLPIVAWDHKLERWEGAVFVAFYAAYVVFLILDGIGHRAKDPFAVIMAGFVLPLTVITAAIVTRQRLGRRVKSRSGPPGPQGESRSSRIASSPVGSPPNGSNELG